MTLKRRLERIEAVQQVKDDHEPVTEIHRVIVNPDGSPALLDDGSPLVIIRKVLQ